MVSVDVKRHVNLLTSKCESRFSKRTRGDHRPTNIGIVVKAALGEASEKRGGAHMGFFKRIAATYHLERSELECKTGTAMRGMAGS